MVKLYLYSKTIHRLLVLVVTVLGLTMMLSGVVLKYPDLPFISLLSYPFMRELHSTTSTFFSIGLFGMIVTGIILFIFPYLRKLK